MYVVVVVELFVDGQSWVFFLSRALKTERGSGDSVGLLYRHTEDSYHHYMYQAKTWCCSRTAAAYTKACRSGRAMLFVMLQPSDGRKICRGGDRQADRRYFQDDGLSYDTISQKRMDERLVVPRHGYVGGGVPCIGYIDVSNTEL